MTTVTTKFTDEELTKLGRAMERSGHTSLEEFLVWAAQEKINATLSTPKQD
jgi:hypothetical protein